MNGRIDALKNKYAGKTCYIVGRGPSLLKLRQEHFKDGIVIALNEAIQNIYDLNLSNEIFSQWRNGDIIPDIRSYLRFGNVLLVCDNPVLNQMPSSALHKSYSPRYTFECQKDLGRPPAMMFSHAAAFEIAYQIFGCRKFIMMGFDSFKGDDRTVLQQEFVKSEYRPGDYKAQIEVMKKLIAEKKDVSVEWFFPEYNEIKLNVGCGSVKKEGYINIDLHDNTADVKMNALDLKYQNNSIDEIYSSHLLEHFGKRDVPKALKEWHRVLRNGGTLSLNLPNLEWCLRNWLNKTEAERHGLALDMIFGLQSNDGEYHKTGFTKQKLTALLTEAGFNNIKIEDHWSHEQSCFKIYCQKGIRITAITCTGDRPEAFELCRKWMENQTVKPDQWLVIDDGQIPLADKTNCQYIRREPKSSDPKHTLLINLAEAFKRVSGEYIFFIEDDEYYAPQYIEKMMEHLKKYEAVGIGRSKYYHTKGGYKVHDNMGHASLAQTAISRSILDKVKSLLKGDMFFDIRIWELFNGKNAHFVTSKENIRISDDRRAVIFDDGTNCLYVGMKAMPGRTGIGGSGHVYSGYIDDKNFEVLKKWLGNNFQYYEKYLQSGELNNGGIYSKREWLSPRPRLHPER